MDDIMSQMTGGRSRARLSDTPARCLEPLRRNAERRGGTSSPSAPLLLRAVAAIALLAMQTGAGAGQSPEYDFEFIRASTGAVSFDTPIPPRSVALAAEMLKAAGEASCGTMRWAGASDGRMHEAYVGGHRATSKDAGEAARIAAGKAGCAR